MAATELAYTAEEEREAERLAIASGLGISEWEGFLSMAKDNLEQSAAEKATRFKPPRVWITPDDNYPWEMPMPDSVEYVRADLHSARSGAVDAAEKGLQTIYLAYESDCGCDCDNENCCAVVGERCAKCFAVAALAQLERMKEQG